MAFNEYDLSKIKTAAQAAAAADFLPNKDFVSDNHWRDGEGWTGPTLTSDDAGYAATMLRLKNTFVSENLIGQGVARHRDGVIGRDPMWTLAMIAPPVGDDGTPAPADDKEAQAQLIAEANAALVAWWDKRDALDALQEATYTLLWATVAPRRNEAGLRLRIPRTAVREGRVTLPAGASPFDLIYIEAVGGGQMRVLRDNNSLQEATVYASTELNAAGETVNVYEFCYIDEQGNTVLKAWVGDEAVGAVVQALGGHGTHHVMRREPLFGESARKLQMALNKTHTMMSYNMNTAFLQAWVVNADIPDNYTIGPGTHNFLFSKEVTDGDGKRTAYPVSMFFREPTSAEPFATTLDHQQAAILLELKQLHTKLTGDAVASGESRKQAMADYLISLIDTGASVAKAGRWLLETVLKLAAVFEGKPNKYDGLRVNFTPRLDVGPVSVDEMNAVIQLVKERLLSQDDGMSRLRVDDPDAMKQAIELEERGSLSYWERVLKIVKDSTGQDIALDSVARLLQLSDEEKVILAAGTVKETAADGTDGDGNGDGDDNGSDAAGDDGDASRGEGDE